MVVLEGVEHAGHAVDGAGAGVGRRAVCGVPAGMQAPADGALVGDDGLQFGRFGDDCGQGLLGQEFGQSAGEQGGQCLDTAEAVFFVDAAGEDDGGTFCRAPEAETSEDGEHGRHAALHVAGSAAVDLAVFFEGAPGVDGHSLARDRVLVGLEENGGLALVSVEPGEDIVPAGMDGLAEEGKPETLKDGLEMIGQSRFTKSGPGLGSAHGILAGDGDKLFEKIGCRVLHGAFHWRSTGSYETRRGWRDGNNCSTATNCLESGVEIGAGVRDNPSRLRIYDSRPVALRRSLPRLRRAFFMRENGFTGGRVGAAIAAGRDRGVISSRAAGRAEAGDALLEDDVRRSFGYSQGFVCRGSEPFERSGRSYPRPALPAGGESSKCLDEVAGLQGVQRKSGTMLASGFKVERKAERRHRPSCGLTGEKGANRMFSIARKS